MCVKIRGSFSNVYTYSVTHQHPIWKRSSRSWPPFSAFRGAEPSTLHISWVYAAMLIFFAHSHCCCCCWWCCYAARWSCFCFGSGAHSKSDFHSEGLHVFVSGTVQRFFGSNIQSCICPFPLLIPPIIGFPNFGRLLIFPSTIELVFCDFYLYLTINDSSHVMPFGGKRRKASMQFSISLAHWHLECLGRKSLDILRCCRFFLLCVAKLLVGCRKAFGNVLPAFSDNKFCSFSVHSLRSVTLWGVDE